MINKIRSFFTGVWIELKKVSWPTKKELFDSTIVVIVSVLILGVFLAVVDQVSTQFIRIILSK